LLVGLTVVAGAIVLSITLAVHALSRSDAAWTRA
jgi:hypothetical protein